MSRKRVRLILIIVFIFGIVILLYPTISQYYNSYTQSKVIDNYNKLYTKNDKDYSDIFDKANEYNQKLLNLEYPFIQYKQIPSYSDLLNINNDGMMGYIEIEKLKVQIPIYHGTSSSVLNTAVGHLKGSSLPIGGESTHSVLSAHRGLPTSKLFTDLNKLEIGDIFEITILNRKLTYQVDNIVIVEPNDISNLKIEDGFDYVTLLTCTPYGLNTHRLLVRGKRIENIDDKKVYVTSEAFKINNLFVSFAVALPIILILLVKVMFKPVDNKKLEDYLIKDKDMEVKK